MTAPELILAAVGIALVPNTSSCFPERAELRGNHLIVTGVAPQQTHVTLEIGHAADELRRDRGIVIRQVAAHDLGDEFGLGGGEQLAADLGRETDSPP